jgi:CHAD domain-containing protein
VNPGQGNRRSAQPDPVDAARPDAAAVDAPQPREGAPALPALGPAPGSILSADSFAAAGRKAMWVQVDRMLQREEAIRDPGQTDALKRYRVATRRLRAALRVFRDAFPRREVKSIRAGLSELADALGKVRDLDVRLEEVDRWARAAGDEPRRDIEPLRLRLAAQRSAAAATLARKLDSRGHRRLVLSLISFVTLVEPEAPPRQGAPDRAAGDRVASSVWAAYEQVRAYAPIVRGADLPTLHGLRVDAKRLRYTIEFLGPLLARDREELVERLVTLQDHLGALNDATLAVAAIRAFLDEHDAGLTAEQRAATLSYLGDRERELGRLRRGVGGVWRPVLGATFARRLANVVVSRPQA